MRAFFKILSHSPDWLPLKSDHACHGDINVANILTLKDKVILIDFAKCFISHKYYNYAQVLNSSWFHSGFHERLQTEIIKTFSLNKNQQKILNSFIIYNLLQRLSAKFTNLQQERFYLSRLETILNFI